MNPAQDIEEVFHAARLKPPGERPAFIRSACGDNPDTVALLESLLASDEEAEDFLERPAAELMTTGGRELDHGARIGTAIGNYQILRIIAAGGMGIVYEAEQASPRRRVALKLLRRALYSQPAVRRFQRESELLGRLRHEGIAQIYEAAVHHEDGQPTPFFAMEFLTGAVPLTEYARDQSLAAAERIAILCKVCDAVQYCHDQGVIHRDLKPGNILVTPGGEPKVIDFGVAQMQSAGASSLTWHTTGNPLIGSLAYMSPEQVGGDAGAVDAQSDVYALGVTAYELLAGRLPFDLADLPPLEAARRIRDEQPPSLGAVDRQWRGDLETITATAMAKEKSRRYPCAAALAADFRRFLHHEPIQARRAGALYQFARFARRNRLLLSATGFVFVVLMLGLAGTSWQALRATRERDRAVRAEQEQSRERERAEEARDEAEAVTEFLTDTLASVDPEKQGKDVSVREVLDRAAERISEKFSEKPLIEARLQHSVGVTYLGLGVYDKAEVHLADAAALYHRLKGERDPQTLSATNTLAAVLNCQGNYSAAEAQHMATLETQRRVLGAEHPGTLRSMNNLANLYRDQGRYEQAEALYVQTLEVNKRVLGAEHPDTLRSMSNLASLYENQGRYAQAEPLHLQTLEIQKRVLGAEHPGTLGTKGNLAVLYKNQGRYEQAEALYVQTLEIRKRVLGAEHPDTLTSMNNLAILYKNQGRYEQAEPLYLQTLEIRKRVLGAEHPATLGSMGNLAVLYTAKGRYDQAEPLCVQTLEMMKRVLGAEHPDRLGSMNNLANLYRHQGRYDQAEPLCVQTLEMMKRVLGAEHPDTLNSMNDLARLYANQGRYEQAEPLSFQAVTGAAKTLSPEHPDLASHRGLYGRILLKLGRLGEAEGHLLESRAILSSTGIYPKEAQEVTQALVNLYQAWDAEKPGQGHDVQAAKWLAKLEK